MPKKKIEKDQNPSVLRTSPLDPPKAGRQGDPNELSYDTKTLITVLLLVTIYPIGVVMMFIWMKWNKWIKFLIVLPAIAAVIIPFFILTVIGSIVMRVGGDLINSGEFREMRRGILRK
jgi:hypothetical protein